MKPDRSQVYKGMRMTGGDHPGEFVASKRDLVKKGAYLVGGGPVMVAKSTPRFGDLPDPKVIQKRIDELQKKIEVAAALVRRARASP